MKEILNITIKELKELLNGYSDEDSLEFNFTNYGIDVNLVKFRPSPRSCYWYKNVLHTEDYNNLYKWNNSLEYEKSLKEKGLRKN